MTKYSRLQAWLHWQKINPTVDEELIQDIEEALDELRITNELFEAASMDIAVHQADKRKLLEMLDQAQTYIFFASEEGDKSYDWWLDAYEELNLLKVPSEPSKG